MTGTIIIALASFAACMIALLCAIRFAAAPIAQTIYRHLLMERGYAPLQPEDTNGRPPDIVTGIGQVVSDGMDRVERMKPYGADRFITFLPMPDGCCWSLMVVRYDNELAAKADYQRNPSTSTVQ